MTTSIRIQTALSAIVAAALLCVAIAHAAPSDVPLTGAPTAIFGPGHVDAAVSGTGLVVQPASFDVVVPADATVVHAALYVTGRGHGDTEILLNGVPVTVPLIAQAGPMPFDATQFTDTQRLDVSSLVTPGTTTFTVSDYSQVVPGGAFVIVVWSSPSAPVQTIAILDGNDYAFHGFAPPFGPDTEVGRFLIGPDADPRGATLTLVTNDAQPDRGDAVWGLVGTAATTPIPASLVGGVAGATALEIDLLGVPVASGGFSPSPQLDIFTTGLAVPAGADYVAFQIESPPQRGVPPRGDSIVMSAALLTLDADPVCGDGILDAGEACDDGEANSDTIPGACRSDCSAAACGDGVVDPGEACDDGAENSDTTPGACRSDCSAPACGDGVVDPNEACDDGAANSDTTPDACRTSCMLASCGDGVTDPGEACDDGEANSDTAPDACRTSCTLPRCGDGVTDSGEACDDGQANSDTTSGACRTDCTLPVCGDGVTDPGEACDDGNATLEDGCTPACVREECGDGIVQPGLGEECEPPGTIGCDDTCRLAEICGTFEDEDGDGLIDCEDPDCSCLPILDDPGLIRFSPSRRPHRDYLYIHGSFRLHEAVDFTATEIGLLITNANGTVVKLEIPAGALEQPRRSPWFRYRDRGARRRGEGVAKLDIRYRPSMERYVFSIKAYGDLSSATEAFMTTQWRIGDRSWVYAADWIPFRRGWKLPLFGVGH